VYVRVLKGSKCNVPDTFGVAEVTEDLYSYRQQPLTWRQSSGPYLRQEHIA